MPSLRDQLNLAGNRLIGGTHPARARQDAETLLRFVLDKNRAWLITHQEVALSTEEAIYYGEMVERRATGEPIQYITGEAEFYGLPFLVTPDVLITRPETEHLVEKVIALAHQFRKPRIVDIGTGSGAIAIALASHLPHAAITAIDLSTSALAIAQKNAKHNGVAIRFLQGELLDPVAGEEFEIIVSNPPYVPTTDRDSLSVEVRDHEPALALFAGADGLDIYRRLIPQAFTGLVPGGYLALEIGYGQSQSIEALLAASGFKQIEFVPDLQSIPRVAVAQHP